MNSSIPISSALGGPAPKAPAQPVSAPTPGAPPTADPPKSEMGKEQFLELLTAQLQHQDPLEPLKNHEFVAQLAQFSGLEQQIAVNENLQGLIMSQTSMANAQMSALIGKDVVSQGGQLQVKADKAQPFEFELKGNASKVLVTIIDQNGQTVATRDLGAMHGGTHRIEWNGQNNSNMALPPGSYRFEVKATDVNDNPIGAEAIGRGKVSGVTFENGYPELIIGEGKIQPADIIEILSPAPSSIDP